MFSMETNKPIKANKDCSQLTKNVENKNLPKKSNCSQKQIKKEKNSPQTSKPVELNDDKLIIENYSLKRKGRPLCDKRPTAKKFLEQTQHQDSSHLNQNQQDFNKSKPGLKDQFINFSSYAIPPKPDSFKTNTQNNQFQTIQPAAPFHPLYRSSYFNPQQQFLKPILNIPLSPLAINSIQFAHNQTQRIPLELQKLQQIQQQSQQQQQQQQQNQQYLPTFHKPIPKKSSNSSNQEDLKELIEDAPTFQLIKQPEYPRTQEPQKSIQICDLTDPRNAQWKKLLREEIDKQKIAEGNKLENNPKEEPSTSQNPKNKDRILDYKFGSSQTELQLEDDAHIIDDNSFETQKNRILRIANPNEEFQQIRNLKQISQLMKYFEYSNLKPGFASVAFGQIFQLLLGQYPISIENFTTKQELKCSKNVFIFSHSPVVNIKSVGLLSEFQNSEYDPRLSRITKKFESSI